MSLLSEVSSSQVAEDLQIGLNSILVTGMYIEYGQIPNGAVLPLRIGGVYFWRLAPPEIGGATAPPSKFYLQNIPPENHRTFWVQDFHACRNKMDMYACKCVENRN